MKKIRNGIVTLFCVILICASSMPVFALARKTAACDKCHTMNVSYGYDKNFGWVSTGASAGKYCSACKEVVPEGESHSYLYSYDRYYFICNSSRCKNRNMNQKTYYKDFDNAPSEHYTIKNGVKHRDY